MGRYLDALRRSEKGQPTHRQNLQNPVAKSEDAQATHRQNPQYPGGEGFVGFVGATGVAFQELESPGAPGGSTASAMAMAAPAAAVACPRWLIHRADREPIEVTFSPPVDQASAMSSYPGAVAAQQLPPPAPRAIPPDIAAAFNRCLRAGVYGGDDSVVLPAMVAADVDATRELVVDMASRIDRCRQCANYCRPGLSGGYCTGRDDLPPVYGHLYLLPDDLGAGCDDFQQASM